MSGGGGSRGDEGNGGGHNGSSDPCRRSWQGPINSPKQTVLKGAMVDDVLVVEVSPQKILVVKRNNQVAGSLTFLGYLKVIDCIGLQGVTYQATITNIRGGIHEVKVEPVS
jgi:hypothetical protein